MSDRTPDRDDVPELPDELDGLPDDDRPKDSPPASEEPADPDAHGPMIQA